MLTMRKEAIMSKTLEEEFNSVRQTFFPSWDKKKQWRIVDKAGPYCPHGCIDKKAHVVEVQCMGPGQSLRVCLVHEIAHAVSSLGHGKEWQDRVERAALKAETIGETSVAEALREEIRLYTEPFGAVKPTADMVYNRIKNERLCCPTHSFDQVIDSLRNDFGLTREEFLRTFKKSRKVYEQTKA
jgi:hypothetical protein